MKNKGIPPEYLGIEQLSQYSDLGKRLLRDALKDPHHPLPHYRLNQKTIVISRTDFHEWLQKFRVDPSKGIDALVDEVMKDF